MWHILKEIIKYVVVDESRYVNFTVTYRSGMYSIKNEDFYTFTLSKQHEILRSSTSTQRETATFP